MLEKINLQLFAVGSEPTATVTAPNLNTNVTTDTGLLVENKVFYDKTLLREANPELVHAQFGQHRPIPKGNGKTIEFRKFSSLAKALTPLTEGVTPDGKKLTVTSITATVKQYGDYIVQSDRLELESIDNTLAEATRILGNQAGLTMDTLTRDVLSAGTNVMYAPKTVNNVVTAVTARNALAADSVLTVNLIQKAVAKLRSNNAKTIRGVHPNYRHNKKVIPVEGSYYVGIIHPYVAYDLMQDPKWETASKYGNPEQLFAGEIGRIAGVRFVQTSEAKIWNDSTATTGATPANLAVYSTLILGADAYGVTEIEGGNIETIFKQKGSAGTADPLNQRSSIGWKGMYTAEILADNYMVRLETVSTASPNQTAN